MQGTGNFDQHIVELLMEHDCVIVPSLGGFLASDVQAQLSPSRHVLQAPRRKIAFNIYLKQNDGLLASHLVEYERITYTEALHRIEQFVKSCFDRLAEGKKVIVERVGTLYYDSEKHLLFEPFRQSQLRKDAFGLSSLQVLPVEEEGPKQRIEKQRKQLLRDQPLHTQTAKSDSLRRKKRVVGIIAVAGALSWFAFNLFLIAPDGGSLSSLNPFKADSQVLQTQKIQPTVTVPVQKTETVFVASVEPLPLPAPKPQVPMPDQVQTSGESKDMHSASLALPKNAYYLVAGVFRVPENAADMLKQLQNKGFSSAALIPVGDLHYVYYEAFSDRTQALALHDSLKNKQESAWIWRH